MAAPGDLYIYITVKPHELFSGGGERRLLWYADQLCAGSP